MFKKLKGFTLSEILIALSVIGVVSALVLPNLIAGNKAATAKAQFNTAYALLTKSIADMDADNVSIKPNSYSVAQFYGIFKHYHKITIDCGLYNDTNTSVCFSIKSVNNDESYKRLSKTKLSGNEQSILDDGAFVLNNGMLVMVENTEYNNMINPEGLLISVDINGKNKKPNAWGYDLFTFELTDNGLLPVGAEGTGQNANAKTKWGKDDPKNYCNPDSDFEFNGITCAYFAATRDDYFDKLYRGH